MKKFSGYEETQTFGDSERLELGGHIVKILEVEVKKLKTKEDKEFEQLILKIDMADTDKQAGYYSKKFASDAQQDAMKAKWKGYYKIGIPDDNASDNAKKAFKTLITSIEKSNPGYNWNWEEKQLVGKVFGGVFGLEEFQNDMGEIIAFSRCRFVRSTEKIEEVQPPKVKLLDGSLIEYEEYKAKRKAERENKEQETQSEDKEEKGFINEGDDLPF